MGIYDDRLQFMTRDDALGLKTTPEKTRFRDVKYARILDTD